MNESVSFSMVVQPKNPSFQKERKTKSCFVDLSLFSHRKIPFLFQTSDSRGLNQWDGEQPELL